MAKKNEQYGPGCRGMNHSGYGMCITLGGWWDSIIRFFPRYKSNRRLRRAREWCSSPYNMATLISPRLTLLLTHNDAFLIMARWTKAPTEPVTNNANCDHSVQACVNQKWFISNYHKSSIMSCSSVDVMLWYTYHLHVLLCSKLILSFERYKEPLLQFMRCGCARSRQRNNGA